MYNDVDESIGSCYMCYQYDGRAHWYLWETWKTVRAGCQVAVPSAKINEWQCNEDHGTSESEGVYCMTPDLDPRLPCLPPC